MSIGIAKAVESPSVPAFSQCGFVSEHGAGSAVLAGALWNISPRLYVYDWCSLCQNYHILRLKLKPLL